MRESFNRVFETYGVDVVFSGHSHTYERSWYVRGHYGLSETFDPTIHAMVDDGGKPTYGQMNDPYVKTRQFTQKENRVVYTVAGNAGHTNHRNPCREGQRYGCTKSDWLQHPVHRDFDTKKPHFQPRGIAKIGSVVLTATEDELRSEFIDDDGEVLDYFVIRAE